MTTTITQYRELARDANGFPVPNAGKNVAARDTTLGEITIGENVRFVRVATDTAVTVDGDLVPADTVSFFGVRPGQKVTVAAAS